jgi:hypothetical protein
MPATFMGTTQAFPVTVNFLARPRLNRLGRTLDVGSQPYKNHQPETFASKMYQKNEYF